GNLLIARAALAKIVPLDDSRVLEQFHGAIDRGDRDVLVDQGTAPEKLLDIGVIGSAGEHARDDPALLGHPHAFGDALGFDDAQLLLGHDLIPSMLRHRISYWRTRRASIVAARQIKSRRSTRAVEASRSAR